ncbi:MAG TPA: L-threonylcarbamoyladenylate synthase [Tepidisphaeraceae bacterium]|nr:L-threonylcarbamoyladenylate synthase [Tepidisphaeraceae bacterium]
MIGGRELISKAVQTLRAGSLVVFPTETVYGLGADATNSSAIDKIYRAKGRPGTNPLIVHVADATVARRYARRWPVEAEKLAQEFWPGPLTLVVLKQDTIASNVTAGKPTVGLRVPSHPLALELLRGFDGPVAAPSANRSNRVSPTTAEHVNSEIGPSVDIILDGGPCQVGIESTVLDLTGVKPVILRPGMITQIQIEQIIGTPVQLFTGSVKETEAASSPGQQSLHYAPNAAAYRFDRNDMDKVMIWCRARMTESWMILTVGSPSGDLAVFQDDVTRTAKPGIHHRVLEMPGNADEYARRLYAVLREIDRLGVGTVWIEMPADRPAWTALRDRLTRATREIPGRLV